MHGIGISVGVGDGRYYDALPLVESGLKAVRREGGVLLARQCKRELEHVEGLMYRLEELAYDDPSDVPPPLSLRHVLECQERARRIQAKEAELRHLRK